MSGRHARAGGPDHLADHGVLDGRLRVAAHPLGRVGHRVMLLSERQKCSALRKQVSVCQSGLPVEKTRVSGHVWCKKLTKNFFQTPARFSFPPDNHKCRNVTYGCCCFANCYCNHRCLIEVDFSFDQFKSTKLKDKEYTINASSFYSTLQKRKIDAPSFQHLLVNV